jgi:hypothetical protein
MSTEDTVQLPVRDAAKIARYVRAFRAAERSNDPERIMSAACRLGYLVENVVHGEDWHKLPGADDPID